MKRPKERVIEKDRKDERTRGRERIIKRDWMWECTRIRNSSLQNENEEAREGESDKTEGQETEKTRD